MGSLSKSVFRKILVANRGEIAVRVIRAIRAYGAIAVAVYSDADAGALHVRYADEAVRIGPPAASDSYLNISAILEAARESGAEAIHPGYGFLSENAEFAQSVVDAGLVFIGPPANVIDLMGNKIAAKRLMAENDVPLVPGYDGADQSPAALGAAAKEIGYPVMLKAAAGGGGRGMREVSSAADLAGAVESAQREASNAFGDGTLFIEKLLVAPRHVEVQVFGDTHGNVVHLFERDCSVQRRHQKVLEEAPSPALDSEQRQVVCEAAVRAARAVGYVNAGTVEFLWQDGNFYFLEMNTRIQVEHGVTELVTGCDLVQAQIAVAAGEPLPWKQGEIKLNGHAVEARLYAEDPDNDFLPQPGFLESVEFPSGEGLRIDTGVASGSEISRFYDPMIAKIMAHAPTRAEAIDRLIRALDETNVIGPKNNRDYLIRLSETPEFRTGVATTALTESESLTPQPGHMDPWILGVLAVDLGGDSLAGWRIGGQGIRLAYAVRGETIRVEANRLSSGQWNIVIDGRHFDQVHLTCKDRTANVASAQTRSAFSIQPVGKDARRVLRMPDGESRLIRRAPWFDLTVPLRTDTVAATSAGAITSPMPGSIIAIHVREGDSVTANQPLLVLEAMKMEHVLPAPHGGSVASLSVAVGDVVSGGQKLIEISQTP